MSENKHNEQLGFDKPPDRYMSSGRETIDVIRDACAYLSSHPDFRGLSTADLAFAAVCLGHVIRYRDRAGLKDPTPVDLKKAAFYEQMLLHVRNAAYSNASKIDDPRAYRAGFEAYAREEFDPAKYDLDLDLDWSAP